MDNAEIYENILDRIESDLITFGCKRSGKGSLFYRYSADRKVACGIEMQKSMFNYPGSYSFTFNFACVGLLDFSGYANDKLTLALLKKYIHSPYANRIGPLCRGRDYWWKITDDILQDYSLAEYYDRFIHADITKCAAHLEELAAKKESQICTIN